MRVENSFIPVTGVGETTERSIWEAGATDWSSFEADLVGPTIGDRIESFIETAEPHLQSRDARFFADRFPRGEFWRLYENFRRDTLFLDIETTGLDHHRDVVTTVSLHKNGETNTLVRGQDLDSGRLRRAFEDAKLLATFNGRQFDVPFLETSFDLDVDVPHLDLRFLARRLDLTGGLKTIEREVGIERDRPDISGRDAVRLWRQYERGDRDALETLVSYNRADTRNLETLLDIVSARLHDRVAPRAVFPERSERA
ncbi:MAG: ribonuclease H-like domain-containing protein [Halodesulfurarchaeum sp.]